MIMCSTGTHLTSHYLEAIEIFTAGALRAFNTLSLMLRM